MTPDDVTARENSACGPGLVLTTGMVLALIAGSVDMSLSILSHSKVLASFPQVLLPLAVTTIVMLLAYILMWYVLVAPIGRLLKVDLGALAIAFAVFVGSLFLLVGLLRLRFSPTNMYRYLMLLFVAVLLFAGSYSLSKGARQSEQRIRSALLGLASPWVAVLAMIFLWLQVLHVRAPFSASSLALAVVFFIAILTVVGLFTRIGNTRFARRGVFVLGALVLLSPVVTAVAARRSRPPTIATTGDHSVKHVILIIIDTLRPDTLSCYGEAGVPTHNIDQLAADGILFKDAISASPWTLPAISSIMSGVSPPVHLALDYRVVLPDSVRTLAEYMQAAGYLTAAIGQNPMLGPGHKLTQGFHEYNWFPRRFDDISLGKKIIRRLFPVTYRIQAQTHDLSDMAIDWFETHQQQEWFLWLHYFDPHYPYSPPSQYLPAYPPPASMGTEFSDRKMIQSGYFAPTTEERDWIRDLYLSEVRYVDDQVGRVTDALKRLGIYDEALIILTSDHGEEFWEHDGFEHGHTLYRELLWVPLIVKLPRQAAQREVTALVTTQSLAPTIMDICEVSYDESYLDARSLTPLWSANPGEFEVRPVFSSALLYFEQKESVTFEESKYIRSRITEREELYDRMSDPKEQTPINSQLPGVAERARLLLGEHHRFAEEARDHFRIKSDQGADLDEETERRLRALGYM